MLQSIRAKSGGAEITLDLTDIGNPAHKHQTEWHPSVLRRYQAALDTIASVLDGANHPRTDGFEIVEQLAEAAIRIRTESIERSQARRQVEGMDPFGLR